MIFFVCGPHCSGKTSLLSSLHSECFISNMGEEIGKALFYERNLDTSSQGHQFELEVSQKEIERDHVYFQSGISSIGIETWHPGNIAYSLVRNPNVADHLCQLAKESPLINCVAGVYLQIPKKKIGERTRTFAGMENWAMDFYSQVDGHIPRVLDQLNLSSRTICLDATDSKENILEFVKSWLGNK